MYLGTLIAELEEALKKVIEDMREYIHIPAVHDFVCRKETDLTGFKRIIREYEFDECDEVPYVISELKDKPINSKYLGMCDRKGEYMSELTEEVEKQIAFYETSKNEKTELNFDKDYAVPDELEEKIFDELYGKTEDTD